MGSLHAIAEPVDDASRGFIPIAVDTLLPSAGQGFDLYLKDLATAKLTLYRRRSIPLA